MRESLIERLEPGAALLASSAESELLQAGSFTKSIFNWSMKWIEDVRPAVAVAIKEIVKDLNICCSLFKPETLIFCVK